MAIAALASCQSYEPHPPDLAAHREAWHGRTLETGSLSAFLERLDHALVEEAEPFDPGDGLTLREGRLVALVFNPRLRLARLRLDRAAASAEHASLWDDPELIVSVLNITESVPDPWVVTPGLTFTIPVSGRLGVQQDQADASQRAEERRVLEAEWKVWSEVRRAWVRWSAARLRVAETERLAEAMDGLVETARELAAAGEVPRTEAALFGVEQAQRRNLLARLRGEVAEAEQVLRALLGLAPEAPVTFVPSLAVEGDAGATTAAELAARNPGLARLRDEYDVAEEALRLEITKQVPDLTLGPLFESDQGQSRVGLLGGIPLPFLNANRRAIAQARVDREIARAALEIEYETLVGRWAVAAARAEALAEQRADMEQVLVPLVERQLEDAVQLMRLGEGTSLVLLESLTRAHQTKLDLIETRSAEALARAEIAYLIGPAAAGRSADAEETNP